MVLGLARLNLDALDALLLRWHCWRDRQGLQSLGSRDADFGPEDLEDLQEAVRKELLSSSRVGKI